MHITIHFIQRLQGQGVGGSCMLLFFTFSLPLTYTQLIQEQLYIKNLGSFMQRVCDVIILKIKYIFFLL